MNRSTIYRIVPLLAMLAALAGGIVFLGQGMPTTDGSAAFPLDDTYIHLQYAWQAAQGQFYQYNSGEAPTTGATSLLYMLLLAAGFALGITREAMPGVILGGGLALMVISAGLVADLARRAAEGVFDRRSDLPAWSAGLLAGVIFAGSGWMTWAFLSGMETGLLIALVTATLWAFAGGRFRLTALLAALAALTRPEALILPVMLAAAVWLIRGPGDTPERISVPRRGRLAFLRLEGPWLPWLLLPLAAGLVSPLVYLLLTGTPSATGLQAKSWLTLVPFYPDRVIGEIAGTTGHLLLGALNGPGQDGRWHAFPLASLLALAGLIVLWRRGGLAGRRLALVCLGWVVLGAAATATLQTATWHHYRYQMPLYPALVPPLAVAVIGLGRTLAARRERVGPWVVRAALVIGVVLWAACSWADFGAAYALDTGTVVRQQMVLADWLRDHTPGETRLAVHDVGVMRYLGERATIDVVGLTTAGLAQVNRGGPGAVYEALEDLQPDYYAVYPDAAPPYQGLAWTGDLLGEELFRVEVDPWSPYTSASATQVVTRPDWSGVAQTEAPWQPSMLARLDGWTLLDRLDVADLDDEAAHDYRWWQAGRPDGFATVPRRMSYREDPALTLADGGRLLTGGESFTVNAPPSGGWLLLVARLHQATDMTVRVRVDGLEAGLWRLPAIPGEWLESAFLIRSDLVRGPQVTLELTVEDAPPDARYSPFHYWVYAGQPDPLPPPPGTTSGATFGEVARLRGFDLPGRRFAPGDTFTLTLHWEALDPPQADTRVFVHLMDPANDSAAGIIAQHDSAPHRGTYPFWVWRRHETVSDAVTLTIPVETPPGEYLLLLGLFDAASGERLPVLGGEDMGADRLVLARLTVQ